VEKQQQLDREKFLRLKGELHRSKPTEQGIPGEELWFYQGKESKACKPNRSNALEL